MSYKEILRTLYVNTNLHKQIENLQFCYNAKISQQEIFIYSENYHNVDLCIFGRERGEGTSLMHYMQLKQKYLKNTFLVNG